jgi:ATP-dependent DNA helicase RecQ
MELLPKETPLLAVTATANNRVIKDVCETVQIKPEFVFKKSFERDNLGYLILEEENKEERLLKILHKANSCGIVYVNTRKKTKLISDLLIRNGIKADFYHGGLPQKSRDEKQKNWIENKTQVIVSTNAFGMGIDKPDVRVVVHFELPASPEAYFQEAGRAGRDGKKSFAVLLYKASDKLMLEKFHELEFPEKTEIKKVYNCLGNYYQLAIGGGMFNNYEFDLADFCNRFNLQPIVAHHCISILSLAGYLTLSEALYRPPRVKIMVSNSNLYTFQVQNKKYDSLIQLLLRNNEGIFDNYMKISPFTASNNLKISETELVKNLTYLTEVSILDFKPASDVPLLNYSQDRVHEDRLILPKEIYLDRKKVKKQQLDFMIKLCESQHICRSKLLLSYFDETEFKNCGICDICIENKKEQLSVSVFDKINSIVSSVVNENEFDIKKLVHHISGFDEKEILAVIQWKLDNNEIAYNKNHKIIDTKKEE